jgi:hypothetical protein
MRRQKDEPMGRTARILTWSAAILVGLIVLTVGAAYLFVTSDDFRSRVESGASAYSGRKTHIAQEAGAKMLLKHRLHHRAGTDVANTENLFHHPMMIRGLTPSSSEMGRADTMRLSTSDHVAFFNRSTGLREGTVARVCRLLALLRHTK